MRISDWSSDVCSSDLFDGSDWDFDLIRRVHEAVAEVAERTLKLDTYPNQIEVITAEQMLDAYSSTGMPQFYKHWSFGKQFVHHELLYRKGMRGLAYELVDRKSVVSGKSVSVRVDLGGRRIIKKKK